MARKNEVVNSSELIGLARLVCHHPICFNRYAELEYKKTRFGSYRGYFKLDSIDNKYFGMCISNKAPSVIMPNKFDWAILLVIMRECYLQESNEVSLGSLHSIAKLIKAPSGGDYSQKVFDSIEKWSFVDLVMTRGSCEDISIHKIVIGMDYKEKGKKMLTVALNQKWLDLTKNGKFTKISPTIINSFKSDFTANLYVTLKNKFELNNGRTDVIKWSFDSLVKHTGAKKGQRPTQLLETTRKALRNITKVTGDVFKVRTPYTNKQGELIFIFSKATTYKHSLIKTTGG